MASHFLVLLISLLFSGPFVFLYCCFLYCSLSAASPAFEPRHEVLVPIAFILRSPFSKGRSHARLGFGRWNIESWLGLFLLPALCPSSSFPCLECMLCSRQAMLHLLSYSILPHPSLLLCYQITIYCLTILPRLSCLSPHNLPLSHCMCTRHLHASITPRHVVTTYSYWPVTLPTAGTKQPGSDAQSMPEWRERGWAEPRVSLLSGKGDIGWSGRDRHWILLHNGCLASISSLSIRDASLLVWRWRKSTNKTSI